jgi:hypothetical protein
MEAFNVPQNPNATSTTDMEPPTADELKPSDAEIAGNAMLDKIDAEHYRKVCDYVTALKTSLLDDCVETESGGVALCKRRGHSSQRSRPYAVARDD